MARICSEALLPLDARVATEELIKADYHGQDLSKDRDWRRQAGKHFFNGNFLVCDIGLFSKARRLLWKCARLFIIGFLACSNRDHIADRRIC